MITVIIAVAYTKPISQPLFFFNDTATTEIYTLSLHDALPIAAANFPDVLMCRGGYQVRPPLPYTPGIELCGEVLAAGPGVTGIAPGDRLIGAPVGGAFAELTLMNAATALPAPDGLDDAEAAAFFVTYQTGWFGLHRRARLAAG